MSIHYSLSTMGTFISAYTESDLLGKLIILSLFALSIICWTILIQKVWMTHQVEQISKTFHKAFLLNKEKLLHLDLSELPKPKYRLTPHPYAEIFREVKSKTVEILNKNLYFSNQQDEKTERQVYLSPNDLDIVETHVLTTISTQSKMMEKNLFILATVITLAPFLGLLGTVWGILVTFGQLQGGASIGSNTAVLGGLSTALTTTVLGLIIAIPALISYNYLKNSSKNYTSDMEDFLYQLLSSVELQYRKADVS